MTTKEALELGALRERAAILLELEALKSDQENWRLGAGLEAALRVIARRGAPEPVKDYWEERKSRISWAVDTAAQAEREKCK